MKRRALAQPGLSYVDANAGRMVTMTEDVLGIKSQIESKWPELQVAFDAVDEEWCIIEHCKDGVDRLVFSVRAMDQRVIERLEKADGHDARNEDFVTVIDRHNEGMEREADRRFEDRIGDFGERFAHALKKDGFRDHMDIFGTKNPNPRRLVNR